MSYVLYTRAVARLGYLCFLVFHCGSADNSADHGFTSVAGSLIGIVDAVGLTQRR